MYTLWVVSEDSSLPATLAFHLRALGEVWIGPPDAGHFKDADPPDLVLVAAAHADEERGALERLLGFLRGAPHPNRSPAPVLYLEPASGRPPTPLMHALIDDRPLSVHPWPIDPQRLTSQAAQLLYGPETPPSLRERARREWVTESVERLYAGLELPALRHAIDPRNAARPILLVGEPGTRRGLLARYVHNLAEPARDEFVSLPAWSLRLAEVEKLVLGRTAGRRATVYLQDLERAEPAVQEELAQLLTESGALGIEPMRWIASTLRPERLTPSLRAWTWLRVDLPPLRQRPDLIEVSRSLAAAWSRLSGRDVELGSDALDELSRYAWPENLRELESVLDASLSASSGPLLGAGEIRFAPAALIAEAPGPLLRRAPEPIARERPEPIEPAAETPNAETPAPSERAASPPPPEASPTPQPAPVAHEPDVRDLVSPLADEIREPLRAIRTYAKLLDQRPDDEALRHELSGLVEGDLSRVERTLERLEQFASFGPPQLAPVDLSALVASELEQRQVEMRERSLVVLRELETLAQPAIVDEEQLRFAIGALLDRALRMVPEGGDLYAGSFYRDADEEGPARLRLLLRFHSPEELLVAPDDLPGSSTPIEVVLARELIERMGGASAVDASGSQDNVILIELPA